MNEHMKGHPPKQPPIEPDGKADLPILAQLMTARIISSLLRPERRHKTRAGVTTNKMQPRNRQRVKMARASQRRNRG